MNEKRALILGITGQDGSYLTELLLEKEYIVHGLIRRASTFNTGRIDHLILDPAYHDRLFLHYGDILDGGSLQAVFDKAEPDEVYNLAAQSHVRVSFDLPVYTAETVAIGALRCLEAYRQYQDQADREIRFYQASSSEMFGSSPPPQNEETPFCPRSPYACAKVQAYWQAVNYREAYKLFVCNGILFNHESPRRGETFVTRKITRALTRIKLGLQDTLYLGNLEAKRDWGYAPEYVEAMWRMLQYSWPDDYVVATGQSHTVGHWLDEALQYLNLDRSVLRTDIRYLRPLEADFLRGDARKVGQMLDWSHTVETPELCRIMCDSDLRLAQAEKKAGRNLTGIMPAV